MSTPMGRMFAGILVQFAEWEQNVLRREARYDGGRYPFGYEPYQAGAYWYLRPHPVYAKEVERMALATVPRNRPGAYPSISTSAEYLLK